MQDSSNLAHFGYQLLLKLLKEWCGMQRLHGKHIGMIPGMRNKQEKQAISSVELVKVVQPDPIPGVHHTAETPRTSNMTMIERE